MALTDLTTYKLFAGITNTSEDFALEQIISSVSTLIEEYCGRIFSRATYTEFYAGNGRPLLVLVQRPVISITSIYLDDNAIWGQGVNAFAADTLLTPGTDYALVYDQGTTSSRAGLVYKVSGVWANPFTRRPGVISRLPLSISGNIKITYVAGYATIPTPLQLACHLEVSKIRYSRHYGRIVMSEGYEEYQVSFAPVKTDHIFSPEVMSILARYRNVSVA